MAVFGDERPLRMLGTDDETLRLTAGFGGEVKSANFAGFTKPASLLVLDFLVGELKTEGSMFSESPSSKISGPRWRFPVEGAVVGFQGAVNSGEAAKNIYV